MWSGAYVPYVETPALGSSGEMATMTRDEQGVWWIGTDEKLEISTGGDTMSANGNVYQLTYAEEGWAAIYQPAMMMIAGTGLIASANEDGTGYTIVGHPDQKIGASGMDDIMTDAGNFRVHMDEDGNFMGMRYDDPHETNIGGVTVIKDDKDTEGVNEAGTMLTIATLNHSIADLFDSGTVNGGGE